MKSVSVLLLVLGLAGCSFALRCYSCSAEGVIGSLNIIGTILSGLEEAPSCREFNPEEPEARFIEDCPFGLGKSCMKITDPDDSSNVVRGCFPNAQESCEHGVCYCTTDLCNSSGPVWPSTLMLLSAALLAAALGGQLN